MSGTDSKDSVCQNTDRSVVTIPHAPKMSDMGKTERMRVVLEFLANNGLALPPRVIHRNLRFHQNITFSLGSVENYLEYFFEEGYVERVDPDALEKREVEVLRSGDSKKAYYIITESGKDALQSGGEL